MTPVVVRKALFTDIEQVCQIEKESIDAWSYNQFLQELRNSFSIFNIAEINGTVVGYIVAWIAADEIQINSIAVKSDCRKIGIGFKLLSGITESTSTRISLVFLEVRSRNVDAIRFYTDNGFTKTGIRKNYYPDDDAIMMEKRL